jgi:hypothetical protein
MSLSSQRECHNLSVVARAKYKRPRGQGKDKRGRLRKCNGPGGNNPRTHADGPAAA